MTIKAKADGQGPLSFSTFHVYILKCADDSYYVGRTRNLEDRLSRHFLKQVAYTSSRLPVELVTWITFADEWKAVLMEKYLKSGSGRAFMKRPCRFLIHAQDSRLN